MESNTSNQEQTSSDQPTHRIYPITDKDLPLVCPLPSESQWDAHPRVFLTLDDQGRAVCPYCGTTYIKQASD